MVEVIHEEVALNVKREKLTLARISEHAHERRIDLDEPPLEAHPINAEADTMSKQLEALLAPLQGVGEGLSVGLDPNLTIEKRGSTHARRGHMGAPMVPRRPALREG